jgi:hypothetical protein
MLRIATKTKLTPEQTIQKAIDFFGSKGYGLKIVEQTETTIKFEGGGGLVDVSADKVNSKTDVDLFSREWEYQTKEFIRLIK